MAGPAPWRWADEGDDGSDGVLFLLRASGETGAIVQTRYDRADEAFEQRISAYRDRIEHAAAPGQPRRTAASAVGNRDGSARQQC